MCIGNNSQLSNFEPVYLLTNTNNVILLAYV